MEILFHWIQSFLKYTTFLEGLDNCNLYAEKCILWNLELQLKFVCVIYKDVGVWKTRRTKNFLKVVIWFMTKQTLSGLLMINIRVGRWFSKNVAVEKASHQKVESHPSFGLRKLVQALLCVYFLSALRFCWWIWERGCLIWIQH